jgi:hypothetical protein
MTNSNASSFSDTATQQATYLRTERIAVRLLEHENLRFDENRDEFRE